MIIVGFQDGVVRILQLMKNDAEDGVPVGGGVLLLQKVLKPHVGPVTSCAVDFLCEILATGVSEVFHCLGRLQHRHLV